MSAFALEVADLWAGYEPDLPILRGASIRAAAGEIVVLLGPNGAGKSTLVKAIAGLVAISAGRTSLDGAEITHLPAHLMVRHGLAYVPQTDNVFVAMTVDENLRLAAFAGAGAERRARTESVYALFSELAAQRRRPAGHLSGGQRQMLAIGRALMVRPRVLILDEPSAGLSPRLVETVFAKLAEIRAGGIAILLVEQNARAALAIGDRAYVLVEGRERHEGPAASLWHDPEVARLYLGGLAAGDSESTP